MENQDYYAFCESILEDPNSTLEERIEADCILGEYYACVADLQEEMENENLSAEQINCLYTEYLELTGSEPQTEFENNMEAIFDSFRKTRELIGA